MLVPLTFEVLFRVKPLTLDHSYGALFASLVLIGAQLRVQLDQLFRNSPVEDSQTHLEVAPRAEPVEVVAAHERQERVKHDELGVHMGVG